MKLSTEETGKLASLLSICSYTGIDAIVIGQDGFARGLTENRRFLLMTDHEIPKFSQPVGLNRLQSLRQRLELFTGSNAVIEAKESDRGEISQIELSAGKNKVQFRCSSTALIKAPKGVGDPETYSITINNDEMKMILGAIKVMGSKTVQLTIKKDLTVSFHAVDTTNESFTSQLETPAELVGEEQDSVVHYYDADLIHAIIKSTFDSKQQCTLSVGYEGTIRGKIAGHTYAIMAIIDQNDGSDEEDE